MSDDMIEVTIEASERVTYRNRVRISKEQYEKYNRMCDENRPDREFTAEFGHLIDPITAFGDEDYEDIYITKVSDEQTRS